MFNKKINEKSINSIFFYIFSTIFTVLLVGLATSTLLTSSWNAYIHDIGTSGAFIVLLIFHLIYGVSISIGVIIFVTNLSCHNIYPKIHTIIISSAMTIIITDVLGAFYFGIGWLEIILGLPVTTLIICKFLYFIEKKIATKTHKSNIEQN